MSDVPAESRPPHPPLHGVPADQPPSALPTEEPADEGARQTLETLRSISQLEESNDG